MPVVTAAVIAVGAAVATTTAATVAAAVVAVSVAVGTIGLAVTAVGLVTGNEDLLKAGKIMGYVGLAGGVAGGVIGGIGGLQAGTGFFQGVQGAYTGAANATKQAWDKGLGSMFNPATGSQVAGPVSGAQGLTTGAPVTAANMPAGGIPLAPGVTPNAAEIAGATLQGPVGAPSVMAPAAGLINTPAVAAPTTPAIAGDYGAQFLSGVGGAAAPATSSAAQSALAAFSSMPDWMKLSAVTTGMQGISGLASGWFQGASAEEKLEFEKLVNAQREGQVQLQNRNAAYAPLLTFKPQSGPAGLINQ